MSEAGGASVHASAVKVGNRAVLIRGPSGSGKSRLAFDLIRSGRSGQIAPAVLVGDDRVHLDTDGGELRVRAAAELSGLIEIRGLGVRRTEFAEQAMVGLVVDLAAANAEPADFDQAGQFVSRAHVQLSRICVQMDTVVADQNGRRDLPGTAACDEIEGKARLARA